MRRISRLFVLPPLQTVLIAAPALALVGYVLVRGIGGPLAYLSYALSAYALAVALTGAFRAARSIQRRVKEHPLGRQLLEDVHFRTRLSLCMGFAVNLLYIVLKTAAGLYYRSLWFLSLAVYYALLAVMRFSLLRGVQSADRITALRRYRLCGTVLLLLSLALGVIVALMVWYDRGYQYPGTLIYAMAAYAFYAVTAAAVSVVKFRKYKNPILSAAKAVSLAAAMVSILSLETAMLAQFGGGDGPLFRKAMTGATGGGVCIIVLGMAVYMRAASAKALKEYTKKHGPAGQTAFLQHTNKE